MQYNCTYSRLEDCAGQSLAARKLVQDTLSPCSVQGSEINTSFRHTLVFIISSTLDIKRSSKLSISIALQSLSHAQRSQPSKMSPTYKIKLQPTNTLCRDCYGEDVCFAISNVDMMRDAIRKGHSYVALVTALDGVCPPNNIVRKQCCRHFVQLQWGSLGQGVRKKVQDCVADAFRFEFPAPNGIYMGHRESYAADTAPRDLHAAATAYHDLHAAATAPRDSHAATTTPRDSHAAEMGLASDTSSETRLEEESDASLETKLEESDNLIVETGSKVSLFQDEEEVVVPETQETVAVIVPETQETVVDLLPHEVINPFPNAAKFKYGGFFPPTLSEGDNHSSYSQFESQFSDPDGYTFPLWTRNGDTALPKLNAWC
jgi:hypothetical protein